MTKSSFQQALENLSTFMDFKVIPYSGRGMYGKRCLAIAGENIDLLNIGYILPSYVDDNQMPEETRFDTFGTGVVYYWPDIPYLDEEDEEKVETA